MTFNADFWVISGTAAPVIALATVVAFRDAFSAIMDLVELGHGKLLLEYVTFAKPSKGNPGKALSAAVTHGSLAFYNFVAQTAALALALVSVADRANAAPFWVVIVLECLGIVALPIGAVTGINAAHWFSKAKAGDGLPADAEVSESDDDGQDHVETATA